MWWDDVKLLADELGKNAQWLKPIDEVVPDLPRGPSGLDVQVYVLDTAAASMSDRAAWLFERVIAFAWKERKAVVIPQDRAMMIGRLLSSGALHKEWWSHLLSHELVFHLGHDRYDLVSSDDHDLDADVLVNQLLNSNPTRIHYLRESSRIGWRPSVLGQTSTVALFEEGGKRWLLKVVSVVYGSLFVDHEEIGFRIGKILQARIPEVRRLDPLTTVQEFIPGRPLASLMHERELTVNDARSMILEDPENVRISLLDFLVGNVDRHYGNVLADGAGKIWAIDHGHLFREVGGSYTFGLPWEWPSLGDLNIRDIGKQISELEDEFYRIYGRQAGDRYFRFVLRRFEEVVQIMSRLRSWREKLDDNKHQL